MDLICCFQEKKREKYFKLELLYGKLQLVNQTFSHSLHPINFHFSIQFLAKIFLFLLKSSFISLLVGLAVFMMLMVGGLPTTNDTAGMRLPQNACRTLRTIHKEHG